ncbi:MAG TPA: Uma2 family endonuclease [Chthoniobacteraceae bacterium]
MSSILDLPSIRARISRVSLDEYHRQPERNEHGKRTELIRGIVVEKMSKSPLHQAVIMRLFRLIWEAVGGEFLVRKDSPLTLVDSEPEPDISVAEGREDRFVAEHPHTARLVIEVALTSPAEDRELCAIYAEAGVNEYWIVLPKEKSIEVYRQPESGRYREMHIYVVGDELVCGELPSIRLSLDALFAGL